VEFLLMKGANQSILLKHIRGKRVSMNEIVEVM